MNNQKQHWIIGLICLLFLTPFAWADKEGHQRLVVFGDSLSDSGNAFYLLGAQSIAPFQLIPDAPYAIGGHHFSNGHVWVELFAKKLRGKSNPVFKNPRNTNYAVGGARSAGTGPYDLSGQVSLYLAQHGSANGDDLYIIMIGGNDVRDAIVAFATDPTSQASMQIIHQSILATLSNISLLAQSGAKKFLIVGVPDLGLVPAVTLQGQAAINGARFLSSQYNQALNSALDQFQAQIALDIKRFDLFAFINNVVSQPKVFGLANVTLPCITPGVIDGAVCSKPKRYLFWDGIHPTKKGHRLIARAIVKLFRNVDE